MQFRKPTPRSLHTVSVLVNVALHLKKAHTATISARELIADARELAGLDRHAPQFDEVNEQAVRVLTRKLEG